jgi:hypothetical protein
MRLMEDHGQVRDTSANEQVLRWSGRLVSAEELRRPLTGHRELVVPAGAVITPLAADGLDLPCQRGLCFEGFGRLCASLK